MNFCGRMVGPWRWAWTPSATRSATPRPRPPPGRHARAPGGHALFPLADGEASLTRLPGHRVRRFSLQRHGHQGRIYFLDGTPTTIVLDLDRDEPAVLHWIGLSGLRDGERLWFDLAARPLEPTATIPELRPHAFDIHPCATTPLS